MVVVNLTTTIEIRAREVNKNPPYLEISLWETEAQGGIQGKHLTHRNRERSTRLEWAVSQNIDSRGQVKRGKGLSSRWLGT